MSRSARGLVGASGAAVLLATGMLMAGCAGTTGTGAMRPAPAAAGPAVTSPTAAPSPTTAEVLTASATSTSTAASAATSTSTSTAVSAAASSTTAGCRNAATMPKDVRTTRIHDVDGDGADDTLFLTTGKPYRFGIRTSSGGTYSAADSLEAGGAHHVWAVNLDGYPGHAVVVDDGLVAEPYQFTGCRLSRLTDTDGKPAYIPMGAKSAEGDATTGVACNDQNGGILLEAVQLRQRSSGRYDVAWATAQATGTDGQVAFDPFTVRYADLKASDPKVARARTSHCWAAQTLSVTHPSTGHPNGGR